MTNFNFSFDYIMLRKANFDPANPATQVNNLASETTLKEVKKAIENINVNVGDIVIGDIAVTSNDTTTHNKLDTLNTTITSKHLNKTTDSIDISGQMVDISGQTVVVSHLNKITDSVDISGQKVDISGQTVVVAHLNKTVDSVDISGQSVIVAHLNKTTDSVDISGQKVDISGQSIVVPHLNKTLDSVDISGQRVDISGQSLIVNTISGFSTSTLQTSGNNLLTDIKNKTLDSNADSVTVYAGGENGLNIRYLASNVDNVDVGLSTYAYSNSNPPFPASRDVLSTQLCGVDNLAGDNLINLVSNSNGSLKVDISGQMVDISGQTVDISGQNVIIPHLNKTTDSVDISGQKVDISGQTVVVAHLNKTTDSVDISGQTVVVAHLNKTTDSVDISGQTVVVAHLNKTTDSVDISGQKVDISGQTVVVAHLNKTTDSVDISGQTVVVAHLNKTTDSVDISGQTVVVAHLDKTTDSVDISGQKVDISGQTVAIAHLNKTTDSVDISGQTVLVAHLNKTTDSVDISGQKVDISGQTVNLGSIGSLDTHCFASSNGTNWHHLASDSNGQLNVHSKLQDGAGTDLTSTLNGSKQSLDVNITNPSGNKVLCDVSGQTFLINGLRYITNTGTYVPQFITTTFTDYSKQGYSLDTASCIYTSGTELGLPTKYPVSSTELQRQTLGATESKQGLDTTSCIATKGATLGTNMTFMTSSTVGSQKGLDVNLINSPTVTISGTPTVSISGTPTVGLSTGAKIIITDGTDDLAVNSIPSSITTTKGINTQSLMFTLTQNSTLETASSTVSANFNAIDTNLTAYNRTNSAYDRLTSVQPIGSANTRALETYSYTVGLNNVANIPLPITSTTTDTTQSLDCVLNNDKTTNFQNITGLNVYPNLMKFKTYLMDVGATTGGFSVLTANSGIITNINNAALIFGASYLKNYFGQITGTSATSKSVLIDYVNSSGVEIVGAPFTITTTNTQILTGIWGVNRVYLATNTGQQQLSTTESINITYTQSSVTIWAANITQYGEFCFSYTVPNGYVACLTQFQFWSQANEGLNINKFSANGTRFRLRTWLNLTALNLDANMKDGGVSGFLSAGDTLLLSTEGSTSTSKRALALINAIKLS